MRFFLDSEFMENGTNIRPLSLGLATENGARLYLVFTDVDRSLANEFVRVNVLPHLDTEPGPDVTYFRGDRYRLRTILLEWIESVADGEDIEFWADYGAYDWVLFCQLWGNMTDLPEGFPMFINDVEQLRRAVGWDGPFPYEEQRTDPEHNAIGDAVATMERYSFLTMMRDLELTPEMFTKADLEASKAKHPTSQPPFQT